ncbi:MAG: DNA recombination protein RmuC [Planctomycetota bacterium]|nr:MAG: DNA recombination protein RmuC [Planctomycetota bacterium]
MAPLLSHSAAFGACGRDRHALRFRRDAARNTPMSGGTMLILGLVLGAVVGAILVFALLTLRRRTDLETAGLLQEKTEQEKKAELEAVLAEIKTAFAALSREALAHNTDDFLKLAKTKLDHQAAENEKTLEHKKKLIDLRLEEMGRKLADLNRLMQEMDKDRRSSLASLSTQIEKTTQAAQRLSETTSKLREALAHPQQRGQWGERMAEDVLRAAGLVPGINYVKQESLEGRTRPDFTFLLPGERKVHMDVKFPLANYLKLLEAADEESRESATRQFLRDVRDRIKEVTNRDYIDPAAGTVDYVLVFIPNEQIYQFIHEHDPGLMDEAMRLKVVLCSPLTLYAIVSVIRQAMDNFHLEQRSRQILDLLEDFRKQWGKYCDSMDALGKRLESAMKEYQELVGVRTRQLDKQLIRIEEFRTLQLEGRSPAGPVSSEPS